MVIVLSAGDIAMFRLVTAEKCLRLDVPDYPLVLTPKQLRFLTLSPSSPKCCRHLLFLPVSPARSRDVLQKGYGMMDCWTKPGNGKRVAPTPRRSDWTAKWPYHHYHHHYHHHYCHHYHHFPLAQQSWMRLCKGVKASKAWERMRWLPSPWQLWLVSTTPWSSGHAQKVKMIYFVKWFFPCGGKLRGL